jgi:phenylacetate-CoA ligase
MAISIFNILAYRKRYGGKYNIYFLQYKKNIALTLKELELIQKNKLDSFIKYVKLNSEYYNKLLPKSDKYFTLDDLKELPILSKEILRENIKIIETISENKGIVSETGGTTGKSLKVRYTYDNMQERFALLDVFRSTYGYKLGKRTAWFSGKNILTKKDIYKNRFWKTDYFYKVRYFSTFHINKKNITYYIQNLIMYKPEYLIGYPSSIYEIAKYGLLNKIEYPKNSIIAIFPTAETITDDIRNIIEVFFNAKIFNQYASSEGAPFVFECINNKLHLELQSGIFEVHNKEGDNSKKGKLIVTSFTTMGTPLIRYDIGDEIELSYEKCTCGNNNPLVNSILGRSDDYVFSEETGKIYLGNISNTLKGTKGIIKFQVIQNEIKELIINIVIDKNEFNEKVKNIFLKNWKYRVGAKIKLEIQIVDSIPVEKSGKFRMVINNITHLVS